MQLDLGLLLAPEIVDVLLDRFVLEAVENGVDGGRTEEQKLNEINDDVQDELFRVVVVVLCKRSELLTLPMKAEDDDEEIIRTIENDNRCNQLEHHQCRLLTLLAQLERIRLRRIKCSERKRRREQIRHRRKWILLMSDGNLG